MKGKRIITIVGVVIAVVAFYSMSILANFRHRTEWKRTAAALQGLPLERVMAAAHKFARDRQVTTNAVPLRTLVAAGYVPAEDVAGLQQRDVAISLTANETMPSEAYVRVHGSDGSDIVLKTDGSIQKLQRH